MKPNNGDLPAMPTNIDAQTLACVGRMDNMDDYYRQQAGLTKREQFAMAAMQGLLSKYGVYSDAATDSVRCADALLAELERTK